MSGIRRLLAIAIGSAVVTVPTHAQSTAKLTVTTKSAGGVTTIPFGSCTLEVEDEVPDGVKTNIVDVQFENEAGAASAAPIALTVWVSDDQSMDIAAGDAQETMYLTRAALAGNEISVRPKGQEAALCVAKVDEEEEPLEIDPAFQILTGMEFISLDGFQERVAHIPAMARWIIPIYVRPAGEPQAGGWWIERKRRHWHRNPYALLTTAAEYTRVVAEEHNFICAGTTIPSATDPGSVSGTPCSANQAKGTDSVTVFREREGENEFRTLGTWRITTSYRHEGNVRWVDNDVYAGPVLTLGVQTDPGIGAPDFFWFVNAGLSLTQVEIREDYFTERFNLQMAWGRSPNFAERVLLLPDSTEQRDEIKVPYTERLHVSTAFQPLPGYYLRGSAEFGEGVPDVARLGIMIQLNVEKLIGSIFGEKEQPKPTTPS